MGGDGEVNRRVCNGEEGVKGMRAVNRNNMGRIKEVSEANWKD